MTDHYWQIRSDLSRECPPTNRELHLHDGQSLGHPTVAPYAVLMAVLTVMKVVLFSLPMAMRM